MAVVDPEAGEVSFKLVYCGTPMGGKTTNLSWIHSRIDGSQRGDLVSLATSTDRTLFFDFLPVHTTVINGYRTRFLLYTVPGQVCYNATRQMVLKGVDGIVFVADSTLDRMQENLVAWHAMHRNLEENGTPATGLPLVLQYNKRDLPDAAPVAYMDYLLNTQAPRRQAFEAAAASGAGVFATLNALAQQVLQRFHHATAPRRPESTMRPPAHPPATPMTR